MWKACYSNLAGGLQRRSIMAQLHIYPDGIETVPEEILNSKYFLYVCIECNALHYIHSLLNTDMY